ncbi:hypothetical protein [Actinoplanes subglobosus]|uniref:NACHT domain-containing protein n=1 Tax=Actinoplanes subglobosus TaxID=1547892 RepID=A0ABV8ISU0_9ACTN
MNRRWREGLRRTGWVLVGVGVLGLGCWVVWKAFGAPDADGFERWVGWANVFALPVGGLGIALVALDKAIRTSNENKEVAADQLAEQAMADLGSEVDRIWTREATLRRVDNRPAPVTVRWSSTARPAAARGVVLGEDPLRGDWRQLPLSGDLTEIVDAFRQLPHRQLLVLGDPGAGKSVLAIRLTLGLLHRPEPGQPVPLLLPINDWDPARPVEDFVAARLAADYGEVLARHGDPQLIARQLAGRRGGVLPILDGLDELPAGRHSQALDAIDVYAGQDRPVVVTCRGREYEQAVTRGQTLLSRAAVIEIEPVGAEAAIAFLSYPEPARKRWQPVFDHLREHPGGPLAAALSTPLMVSLARTAYQDPDTDPADLRTMTARPAITAQLMDGFVASVYTDTGVRDDRGRRVRSYSPQRAGRWIGCLAYHLYLAGTRDLHWWQIPSELLATRPGWARRTGPAAFTAAAAVIAGLGGHATGGILPAAIAAVCATGLVGGSAAGWFRRLWPTRYQPYLPAGAGYRTRRARQRSDNALRAAQGLGCGLLASMLIAPALTPLVGALATAGLICGLLTARTPPKMLFYLAGRPAPTGSLRDNCRNVTAAALYSGGIGGVLAAATVWPVAASTSQIALAAATAAGVFAAAAALGAGGWTWIRFRLTHTRLALHGWLPWRLEAFYHDAHHHRGVLRQAGTIYQFRHVLLQDHLATTVHPQHLRARVDAGDESARERLARLLAEQGHVDEAIALWRARADTGDRSARERLAHLLARQGHVDELRARADTGDESARERLAHLLARQGHVDELRARADTGDRSARERLAHLLARQGHVDELRARADTGDRSARERLAQLLARQGHVDEAIALWRARANTGDESARSQLAQLLAMQGHVDELRARADTGDWSARSQLAQLLARQGHVDEAIALWRARANTGDWYARSQLAQLLARQGHVDELRARANTGDRYARSQLAQLLAEQGHIDELRARANTGDRYARSQLAQLLAEQGHIDELRARADTGDESARSQLAQLLARQGHVDEAIALWRARADTGDRSARSQLAQLLAEQGHVDELRARANTGDESARSQLAQLLARQGHVDEAIALWRARADTGDRYAREQLTQLLAEQGHIDELRARADTGDWYARSQLAHLLAEQGHIDELPARADTGDESARE